MAEHVDEKKGRQEKAGYRKKDQERRKRGRPKKEESGKEAAAGDIKEKKNMKSYLERGRIEKGKQIGRTPVKRVTVEEDKAKNDNTEGERWQESEEEEADEGRQRAAEKRVERDKDNSSGGISSTRKSEKGKEEA